MMHLPLKPFIRFRLLKLLLGFLLLAWATTSSIWAYRNKSQIILIGLDDAGTRVITSASDPILAKERVKFVREFLRGFYNYSSTDYSQSMSQAGALISDTLWKEKETDFKRIVAQMKLTPLTQEARLLDLREVSEQEFEADLDIHIRSRLQERTVKYRVALTITPKKRSTSNPYPLEVTSIHETEIN